MNLKWLRSVSPDEELDEIPRHLLIRLFRARRRTLLTPHGTGKGTTAERLNRKRFARDVVRRWRKSADKQPGVHERLRGLHPEVLAARFRPNAIADALLQDRRATWIPIPRRLRRPEKIRVHNFSFIDNPNATFGCLRRIVDCEARGLEVHVDFDDDQVLDIGAYLVLAELWSGMTRVFAGGRMSLPVQRVIDAVRLRRPLRMAPFRVRQDAGNVWALPVQRRTATDGRISADRLLGPQRREKVTDDFCDWIDRCLGVPEIDLELTTEGKAWLARMIAELLDNAERHSALKAGEGMWSIAGFMCKVGDDFVLSMAILSLGRTISESLETCSEPIRHRLEAYCQRHRGFGASGDALRTVVAIQDYVTRVSEASENNRGGIGFQEVIDFANEIGHHPLAPKQPRIAVISGDSCVQIGNPYIRGVRLSVVGKPRELWFNLHNSADNPPAISHVYDLNHRFPGTVIAVRLSLDPQVLRASVKA